MGRSSRPASPFCSARWPSVRSQGRSRTGPGRGPILEVGALLAPVAYSDGTWETCTGTLISPTVFLTAAHCDQGISRVAVTFASSYSGTSKAYWGTWNADRFRNAQSDPYDIAVVVLTGRKGITPARLPAAGSLDKISPDTRFTSVGYGAQSVTIDHGPTFHYADIRYVASGGLCRPRDLVEDLDEPRSR